MSNLSPCRKQVPLFCAVIQGLKLLSSGSCHALKQKSANFSVKGQLVNTSGFVGHIISVTTTDLGPCSKKSAPYNTQKNEHGCVPRKVYLQKKVAAEFDLWTIVFQPWPKET